MAERVREFNRYYTRRIGILTDRYLGRERPLGEARLLFEIGTGASVRSLRARMGLDPGYLSRLLRSLERQGLVEVTDHPDDGRARLASPTDTGIREQAELNARATASAAELLSPLTAPERESLVVAMDQVQALLRLAAIAIRPTAATSALARTCLRAYADELRDRFPEGYRDRDLVAASELAPPRGVLLLATEDGRAVGCAALRTLEAGTGEVRHMWVHPDARRLGLGRRMLGALERHGHELGFHMLRLGTHEALREAIAMYRALGYRETPPYGDTAHTHHWFAKDLRAATR